MNHDYVHCADYKQGKCPKECFRGELVRDLNSKPWLHVSFASLKGSEECLLSKEKMMNKTCKGCYAAETLGHPLSGEAHGCTLNYKTDGKGHPAEECPKPKSWKQLSKETPKEQGENG